MHSAFTPTHWALFCAFVLVLLALDLGVFHRKSAVVKVKEALVWSALWMALAAVFGVLLYFKLGATPALEFAAGYVIEKSLSVDNLFVFVVLFGAFSIPPASQHRVLFWGVLGALVLRGLFVLAGSALLAHFHWVIYVFGALLLVTAFKLARDKGGEEKTDAKQGFLYRTIVRYLPTTDRLAGERFFVRENGRRLATPLFITLVLVEITDVIFAVDSIPAVFAITSDPFIVFTSNVFAILGLRSLYFVLADFVHRFHYLKPALAIILGIVGMKMMLVEVYKPPILLSLGLILGTLAGAVLLSIRRDRKLAQAAPVGSDSKSSTSSILKGFSN